MPGIVEYNKKKVIEIQVEELRVALTEAVSSDPPLSPEEMEDMIQQKKKAHELPEAEIIQVFYIDSISRGSNPDYPKLLLYYDLY